MTSSRASSPKRTDILRPLGLITTPNQYGQLPDGALSQADNVLMRKPGKIQPAQSTTNTQALASSNDKLYELFGLDAGHVYAWTSTAGNVWSVWENGNTAPVSSGGTVYATGLFNAPRICPMRARDRMLVNSQRGVLVGDVMQPTNIADRTLRLAGMTQPKVAFINSTPTTNGTIPNNIMVAYACVLVRTFSDGYTIRSVPSPSMRWINVSGGNVVPTVTIAIMGSATGVIAGDVIELYRTDGLSTSDPNADPGAIMKLIYSHTLTIGEIGTGGFDINDNATLSAPLYTTYGRELYTNPGQERSTQANRQPDICGAQAVFKTYAFYGNLTERPQLTISVPAGMWVDTAMNAFRRANGIGARSGAGTSTIGSPVITGVSAADIVGIKPGQIWWTGLAFNFAATVSSVGVNTITMDRNAIANSAVWALADQISINGTAIRIGYATDFVINSAYKPYEITPNQSLSQNSATDTTGISFVVEPFRPAGLDPLSSPAGLSVFATNGANYSPPLPEWNTTPLTVNSKTTTNLYRWSKNAEPEHVPTGNEGRAGTGGIIAFIPTRDAMWTFCTDGLFRLSGDAGDWRLDPASPELVLCGPRCACNVDETVYALTNKGFVSINDATGVVKISDDLIRELMPGSPFSETADLIVSSNPLDSEVLISLGAATNIIYVYNIKQKAFTRITGASNPSTLTAITTLSYLPNPASGNACPLIGTSNSGAQPQYAQWNATNSFLIPQVTYQPVDDKSPTLTKQFIDMTFIFDQADVNRSISGQVNGLLAGSASLVAYPPAGAGMVNDARCNIGVIQNYAIGPTLRPGFTHLNASTQSTFLGISLRYVPLTYQQWRP